MKYVSAEVTGNKKYYRNTISEISVFSVIIVNIDIKILPILFINISHFFTIMVFKYFENGFIKTVGDYQRIGVN